MSAAEATCNAITAAGAGAWGIQGGDLFLGTMQDVPDFAICVYEYDGLPPVETMGPHAPIVDTPRIQVVVRGAVDDYQAPRDRALAIRTYLAGLADYPSAGLVVMRWAPQGVVMPLGVDGKQRHKFSLNLQCWVR